MREQLRAALARYAHDESWSKWMKYQFDVCERPDHVELEGQLLIPKDKVERWTRQMETPFDDLPDGERKSGCDQADKILEIIDRHISAMATYIYGHGDCRIIGIPAESAEAAAASLAAICPAHKKFTLLFPVGNGFDGADVALMRGFDAETSSASPSY